MLQKKYYFVGLLILLISTLAMGAQVAAQFMNTQDIPDFDKAIASLKEKTKLPVVFPQKIPVLLKRSGYYIYVESEPVSRLYTISIDTTPTCHGAHYCNVGMLIAAIGGNPQIYSMDNHELTESVTLAGGKKGYFTIGHAVADFWAPQIEWREGDILYRLSWNLPANAPAKEILVSMVNSVKAQ